MPKYISVAINTVVCDYSGQGGQKPASPSTDLREEGHFGTWI